MTISFDKYFKLPLLNTTLTLSEIRKQEKLYKKQQEKLIKNSEMFKEGFKIYCNAISNGEINLISL